MECFGKMERHFAKVHAHIPVSRRENSTYSVAILSFKFDKWCPLE